MNKRSVFLAAAVAALLAVGVWVARKTAFDWQSLRLELRSVSLAHIALGCMCIYVGFILRAMRWAVLMKRDCEVKTASLIGPQFTGFAAVALFGRLADFTRPYLIARRTSSSVASQVAVYSIERIFDLIAAAILFSIALALAPPNLANHATFVKAGVFSIALTAVLSTFVLSIRLAGERLAPFFAERLKPLSAKFAEEVATKIIEFQSGLKTLRNAQDGFVVLILSLLLWLGIAEAYVQSARAFQNTPSLAALTLTQAMLMMATSMGGSLFQLPVVGWFTQIFLLATAIHISFNAPLEAATACSAVALFVTVLSIVPAGLVAARIGGTSLRAAAREA